MFDTMLQGLDGLNFNVQIPAGYVVMGLLALATTWYVVKKAIALAFAVVAKVTFGSVCCGALMLGGLGGTGLSIGEMQSGEQQKASKSASFLTNQELIALAKSEHVKPERLATILEYAKARDKVTGIGETYVLSLPDEPVMESKDYKMPGAGLGISVAMILTSIVWFAREHM